jgi:predicted permease
MGGSLGMLLSFWATQWLAHHWHRLPRAETVHIDGVVLTFSLALVFLAALLSGLLPAISSTGKGLLGSLQESSRTIGGSSSRAGLRRLLLTAEIALTVILLVSAGLLFKTFLSLRAADMGCLTDNVLTLRYGLPQKQYDKPEMIIAFHEGLLERVRRLPGVRAAGLVSVTPGSGHGGDRAFTIPEHPSQRAGLDLDALVRLADPGYFNAVGIPLLNGRFFGDQDRLDRSQYVVVSKQFAHQYFSGENPLGKHITMSLIPNTPETYEIIGVAGDTLHRIGQPTQATVYFPYLSGRPDRTTDATLVVHTSGDALSESLDVQKQFADMDPSLPVFDVLTMHQIIEETTGTQSFNATLVGAFAMLSLLLAAVGLYGVLSYLVSQRVLEIGIRMALGAQRGGILRLILMDGLRPVFFGLLLGSGGGIASGVLIRSMLYGTRPADPAVFSVMIGSLLLTALLASMAPALRACRIEPAQALKTE